MPRSRAQLLAALITACCALAARGATGPLVRVSDGATPMGTYMLVTVYAPDEAAGRQAIAAALQRVEEVEAATSHYRDASDISRLNRAAGGPPVAISSHLYAALHRAAEISADTNGAFDATIGPVVALWQQTWRKGKPPAADAAAAARALVDYRAVRLLPAGTSGGPRAQLLKAGMRVDLSGIAKGYAVDQAVAAVRERGISAVLVDAGGDIYGFGAPPERESWLVGVRDPARPGKILPQPLRLRNRAVATSGDYEQFGQAAGRRWSHILDPRTGKPVEGMTSVTVVAPDCATADAYATALSVMGPEAAVAFADRHPGIEVMVLYQRNGAIQKAQSKGFEALLVTPESAP